MCSIIGYLGSGDGAPLIVKALRKMEYRGYDSAGVAMRSRGLIVARKGVGKVEEVNSSQHLDELSDHVLDMLDEYRVGAWLISRHAYDFPFDEDPLSP